MIAAGTATPRLLAPLGIALPVEARKRYVFSFACREPLPRIPLTVDPSGVYVRSEGDVYICGASPPEDADPPATDFEVDHALLRGDGVAGARHAHPGLRGDPPGPRLGRALRLQHARPERDRRPRRRTAQPLVATGFSGHGLQQSPGVGRGLAELVVHGRYVSLDLAPLGYERIAAGGRWSR